MQKLSMAFLGCALLANTTAARADTPFYLEAGIGHVSVDDGSFSLTPTNSSFISGTGDAESLIGGWRLDDLFAMELAYHDYGNPTASQQNGTTPVSCPQSFSCPHVSGLSAELVAHRELAPDLDGELLLGVLDWHVSASGSLQLANDTGNDFIYGLRVMHSFDNGWSAGVTYERSNFTTEETRLSVRYSF